MIRRQRGAALLLALWVTALLAALLVGVAAASRSHSVAALYGAEHVRAELAAEAGLARAVAGLRAPGTARWVPDGRPYAFDFDGARVTVRVVDVSGLVDLNAAAPALVQALLQAEGVAAARAAAVAGGLAAARAAAPNGIGTAAIGAAARGAGNLSPGARGRFRSIDELARLPGMDAALLQRLTPEVTVFSGRDFPDAAYAGAPVIAALRGLSPAAARTLVDARRARPAREGRGNALNVGAVAGGPLVAGPGGIVERVFSVAEMPDGARANLDVTLRLALTGMGTRPYKVLDWRTVSAIAP